MESLRKALPEEIALEGLDGITLETLFVRLTNRLDMTFDEYLKEEVWNIVKKLKKVEFFEIENDRPTPQIFERTVEDDEEFKKLFERDYNIYSFDPVDDPNVQGSCKEFKTRKPVEIVTLLELDLSTVMQKYKNTLVIVASQTLRSSMLIPCNLTNEIELPKNLYCALERIGRSRYLGEMSSGPCSLNNFINENKSMFYIRRQLLRSKLIWRQTITENKKGLNKPAMTRFQLFLPQYFTPIKIPKNDAIEKIHSYLKSLPRNAASVDSLLKVSELINRRSVLNLIRKFPNFKVDVFPYFELYPDKKNSSKTDSVDKKSRMITGVELVDPNLDVFVGSKDEEEEIYDEKEVFLNTGKQLINVPLANQIYNRIVETGSEGMSQQEIATYFGLSRLNSRAIVRKLQATKEIGFYIKDEGRQRTFKYVTKDASATLNKQASQQMERMLTNVSEIKNYSIIDAEEPHTASNVNLNEKAVVQAVTVETFDQNEKFNFTLDIYDTSITVSLTRINCIPGYGHSLYEIKKSKNLSEKILSRVNIVLETVKSLSQVEINEVWNVIRKKESVDMKEVMCRKSLGKIVSSLSNEEMIEIVQAEVKMETKGLRWYFLCEDKKCLLTKEVWLPIIEGKILNYKYGVLKGIPPSIISEKTLSGIQTSEKLKSIESLPKFIKMRKFHEFLFYLIYECKKEYQQIPIQNVIQNWKKNNPKLLNVSEIDEEVKFCSTESLNWKTFLSPLNKHENMPDGWCLIRDIIYRMPLILIASLTSRVKLAEFNKTSPEFIELLNHPIKCNYLLHFLPEQMQKKFIPVKNLNFLVMELCRRLCLFGLLKFGPSRGKENDNNFIFLNLNASILDTTSSDQGHLEISDKEYPISTYHFESSNDLYKYWDNLCDISLRTPLMNFRVKVESYNYKEITSRESMQAYLKPVGFLEAPSLDDGEIPGDHKGAGGLDKGFYAFQRRSWIMRDDTLTETKHSVRNTSDKIRRALTRRIVAQARNRGMKISQKSNMLKLGENSKVIRRNKSKSNFTNLDLVDKQAMKLSRTSRACWYESEDKTLILIKVAMKFMFKEDTPNFDYSVIRDILHWKNEKSLNKTTKMCIRRIANLMKKQSSREKIILYLEELGNDPQLFCKYRNVAERLKRKYQTSSEKYKEVLRIVIVEFVILLHHQFYKRFNLQNYEALATIELPNDFSELLQNYTIKLPLFAENLNFEEPNSIEEIEVTTLLSFIIGVVNVLKENPDYSNQVLDVFKSLDDRKVRTAISCLRKMTMISICKRDRNHSYASGSVESYNLSSRYQQAMTVHSHISLFKEIQEAFAKLLSQSKTELNEDTCGWVLLLANMTCSEQICLKCEKADKLVIVDPHLRKKSNFLEISDNYIRYQTSKNQGRRRVRISAGEANDDVFTYNEDPIEWFLRINVKFLHIFCILVNMKESKEVLIKKFELLDTEWCCLDTCIFQDEQDFETVISGIAENFQGVITQILEMQDHPKSKQTGITKSNLISFFDEFMKSQVINHSKKDYHLKAAMKRQEISTVHILRRILDYGSFIPSEDSWLQDYDKNSKRNEDSLVDDDDDISSDPITYKNMARQLKDLNVIRRVNDSFVVNFSAVSAHVKEDLNVYNTSGNSVEESLLKYAKWSADEFSHTKISSKFDSTKRKLSEKVLSFIKSKEHNGADTTDLVQQFHQFKASLVEIIDVLVKNKNILKTGVKDVRFVDKSYAHYWMINSQCSKNAIVNEDEEPENKKMKLSACAMKAQETETIFIMPAPWIRVDGTICHNSLVQWFGTLLAHINLNPGIMMTALTDRFNVLKPFEVRYLCESLQDIGCIQLRSVENSEVNLFSLYADVAEGPANSLSKIDDIYIEMNANAMIKFCCFKNSATRKSSLV